MSQLEQLQIENQTYRDNMPKFKSLVSTLNNELSIANDEKAYAYQEAEKYKKLYKQAINDNALLNKFNLAYIGITFGVIGGTIIYLLNNIK